MKPAVRRFIRLFFAAIAVAVVAILLGIVPFNAGFVRGLVETTVRDNTGLEFQVGGPVKVRLGLWPSVDGGNLVLGEASHDPLLAVDSLRAKIGLVALLRGRIHVHELQANGVRLDYCSLLPEFQEDSNDDTAPPSVAVDAVELRRITIRCGPPDQADPLQIEIVQALGAAPAGQPIQLSAEGSVSTIDFTLTATGGELDQLFTPADKFPLRVSFSSAATSAEVSGHLHSLATRPSIDARIEVRAADTQSLAEAFDLSLPAVGALHAVGHVSSDFSAVELHEVRGELGDSRFAFDAAVDANGERPHVGLTATLQQLDLAPFMDDGAAEERPGSAAEQDDVDLSAAIDMLSMLDADLLVSASRILGTPLDLDAVEARASMTNGLTELHTLTAKTLGGSVSMTGSFDSRSDCPALNLLLRGREFDLATLNAVLSPDTRLGGHVDTVDLDGSSCGRSLFAHRDSLRARAELAGGRLSLDGEPLPLEANRLDVSVEPGKRSRVQLLGELANERLKATLTAGSLQTLLKPGTWPVELQARGVGGRLQVTGQAGLVSGQPVLDTRVEFEAPRLGTLHPWTDGSPDAELPLRTTARLRLDESRLIADAIAMSLGQSDVGGRLVWHHARDPDILDLTLRSGFLDLDEISAAFPATIEASEQAAAGPADDDHQRNSQAAILPPVDLDLKIDAMRFNRLDLQEFNLGGRLRAGLIDDAHVDVLVEDEVLLRGVLDLDLRRLPARGALNVAAENVDIGLLLAKLDVADDLRLRADGLDLLVTTAGKTLTELLGNTLLETDIRGFHWRIPKDNPALSEEPERAYDLSLAQLSVTAAPGQPTGWTSSGQLDDVQLELWMETPSLVDIVGEAAELPLTLVAAADNDVVMLDVRVDRSAGERLAAHVVLSGQVLESENRSLAGLVSPLADYEIRSDILLTEDRLELPDLKVRIGSSKANGSLKIAELGSRRRIDVVLHGPYLQTDDLLYWSRDFRGGMINDDDSIDDDEVVPDTDDDDDDAVATQANSGVFSMAGDFIAEIREGNDLNVTIAVDELRAGNDLLGDAELRLYVDEDEFRLQPVTFNLPGGGVDAAYTYKITDGKLDADFRVRAEALSYGGLLRLADHESEAQGLLYLDTEISASTEWVPGALPIDLLLSNANGSVSQATWPENVEAGVLDLWTANLVLALLPPPAAEERSRLNCVVARLDVKDGVMKTRNVLLDTTETVIRGRGTIDLAREELDLLIGPQAKREKFLSASTPVKVTGSFDDFQIGVESGGFLATALKWYTSLIYVPFKWLTGERFPADGTSTCFDAMDWELTPELNEYFLQRDFSAPPSLP